MRIAIVVITGLLFGCGAPTKKARVQSDDISRTLTASETDSILLISDIHFDPVYESTLFSKLKDASFDQWTQIFESSSVQTISGRGKDTNFPLFRSSLEAMKKAVPNPSAVIITGDFFRHSFRPELESRSKLQKAQFELVYGKFTEKLVQFLAQSLRGTFPNAQMIPVLGNNDATCGDYGVYEKDPVLSYFKTAFELPAEFSQYGHYSVNYHANKNLKFVVSNDVYLASNYNHSCGPTTSKPDDAELDWLSKQLSAADQQKEHVWVIQHLPPGVDVSTSTFRNNLNCENHSLARMFKKENSGRYNEIVNSASSLDFVFAGHTHFDEFRLAKNVAVIHIPSISPNMANNPSFQVLSLDRQNLNVKNVTVYSLNLDAAAAGWIKTYDFNSAYRANGLNYQSLVNVAGQLNKNHNLQKDYITRMNGSTAGLKSAFIAYNWKAYSCGMTNLDDDAFLTCFCE